jgi:hypothetical protein
MYVDFDNYLSSDFSDDYWSDEGISFAEAKLYKFSDKDWLAINEKWKNKNCFWLIKCASVLGDFNDSKSMELLMEFLAVDDIEVQIAALDSINSLLSMDVASTNIDMRLSEKINDIESSSMVVKIMIDSLKSKLKK